VSFNETIITQVFKPRFFALKSILTLRIGLLKEDAVFCRKVFRAGYQLLYQPNTQLFLLWEAICIFAKKPCQVVFYFFLIFFAE